MLCFPPRTAITVQSPLSSDGNIFGMICEDKGFIAANRTSFRLGLDQIIGFYRIEKADDGASFQIERRMAQKLDRSRRVYAAANLDSAAA